MSADLLAAFGPNQTTSRQQPEHVAQTEQNHTLNGPLVGFDDAREVVKAQQKPLKLKQPKRISNSLWQRDEDGAEVLFDSSLEVPESDDDFGDFEEVQDAEDGQLVAGVDKTPCREINTNLNSSPTPPIDLLGLDEDDAQTTKEAPPESSKMSIADSAISSGLHFGGTGSSNPSKFEDEWGEFSDAGPRRLSGKGQIPPAKEVSRHCEVISVPEGNLEDDWEPFEDGVSNPTSENWITVDGNPNPQFTPCAEDIVPPSNIPPPAILLQLLPQIFQQLREANTRSEVDDNHQRSNVTNNIIRAHKVSARIIAGRTLRWKRDSILAQSTKIGPAGSGKGRGMKLAAVDKSESLKEDKEAADVVRAWERHAHFFNSAANNRNRSPQPLMVLSTNLRPKAAQGAGVLSAAKPCIICGIKRDERIPQVDLHAEDSFGEFWVEHWGHYDCQGFWLTYKDLLGHR